MASECSVRLVTDAAEWESLFSTVEHPHVTQSWAYGEAKRASAGWRPRRVVFDVGGWRPRRLVISRTGEPVAICQMPDKCLGAVPMASRLNQGRCSCEPIRTTTSSGTSTARSESRRSVLGGRCSWRPRCRTLPRPHYLLSISSADGQEPALELAQVCEPCAQGGRRVSRSACRQRTSSGGGTVCYRFGKVGEILILWLGPEGRRANARKYLDWSAALELKRRGCQWFDLGGKRPRATEQFKAGLGGAEYRLLNERVAS